MSSEGRARSSAGAGAIFLLLVALFWCALVGFFDFELGGMVVRQALTGSYAPGRATILKCELVRTRGSEDGDTHGVEVLYSYRVGGREHTSERYAFNALKSSDSGWAREALRRYPQGTEAPFYYDPKRPELSVLRRGLDGSDFFVLMFLAPFNAVGLGLAAAALASLRGAFHGRPALVSRSGRNLREHIDAGGIGPLGAFLAALGLGCFAGIFVVAFSGGFHPSLLKVGIVWGAVLAIAVWTALRAWGRAAGANTRL